MKLAAAMLLSAAGAALLLTTAAMLTRSRKRPTLPSLSPRRRAASVFVCPPVFAWNWWPPSHS